MLGFSDLRMAAHKGLMQAALAEGDAVAAQRHADAANALARTAPRAWRAALEAKLAGGDWAAALELLKGALERKIVSPIVAESAKAALLHRRRPPATRRDGEERARQSAPLKKPRPPRAPAPRLRPRRGDGRAA